jgi:hypothetical protein
MTISSAGHLLVRRPFEKTTSPIGLRITHQKALKLQSYSIEQLAVRVTGDIAIDHYRIKANWAKSDTAELVRTKATRITHTWVTTNGTWQILGGMSAPVNAEGK